MLETMKSILLHKLFCFEYIFFIETKAHKLRLNSNKEKLSNTINKENFEISNASEGYLLSWLLKI